MSDKILIIGSSGYLGSNIIKKLNLKNKIICFDKQKKNFSKLEKKKIYRIYTANLDDKKKINEALKKTNTIFFRAGFLGGPNSNNINTSKVYLKENVEKLINFLEIAKKYKIKKIIFDSSFQVFGRKNVLNKEIEPYNYYGLSKLTSEKILKNWCKFNYVDLIIFRYPRIVCENSKNFLSKMVLNAMKYSTINLNNPLQKFRLVHLEDVLNANIQAINSKSKGIHVFNVSIKKEYSLNEISKIIKLKLKSKIKIKKTRKYSKTFEPLKVNLDKNFFRLPKKYTPKIGISEIISRQITKIR